MTYGYSGPECPACAVKLDLTNARSGAQICPYCNHGYEAVIFNPPRPRAQVVQVAGTGPEAGTACANHARNAAVTSCTRCGLLICTLCDMNLGTGSYCPSCFERVRVDGTLGTAARKYRDYASMTRLTLIVGFLLSFMMLGLPAGALAMYYGFKGVKQRRAEGRPEGGMIIAIILGALEALAGGMILAFLLWSLFQTPRTNL